MKKVFVSLLFVLYSLPIAADNYFPPPFTATYSIFVRSVLIANGTRILHQKEANTWQFTSTSQTTGLFSYIRNDKIYETTSFKLLGGKIQPQAYFYEQVGRKKKKVEISFDWNKKIASGSDDNGKWVVSLEEGTLDKLLYQLVVMQDLQQGKRDLQYKIIDKGKIKTYIPTFLGEERIKTRQSELKTLKYEKVAEDGERSTTLWCAPELHFLPIQVEHDEKGELIKLLLDTVKGLD